MKYFVSARVRGDPIRKLVNMPSTKAIKAGYTTKVVPLKTKIKNKTGYGKYIFSNQEYDALKYEGVASEDIDTYFWARKSGYSQKKSRDMAGLLNR